MINTIIRQITDQHLNQFFYNLFFVLGFVGVLTYNLINCKNYGLSRKKALILTVVVYSITVIWMFILFWAFSGFKKWGGNNIVRIFIWVPLIAWPVCKAMKIDWKMCCDYLSPCVCVVHGIAHFGCIFEGCCNGYPWEYGIYNPVQNINTFPIQPIEAITALLIVFIVAHREKKKNYVPDGLSYPIMLILFGYSRFLYEFLRNNIKLFLGVSELALHALSAGIVGTVMYLIIRKRKQISKYAGD
ncbi:MAG: prolipoprotein diacylglyceryl transferase [Erysipelotrichaceae bacterium]|nr:prolipoprotein diacylglyceryl transferase [Erysipelotrichaceae bacterium]